MTTDAYGGPGGATGDGTTDDRVAIETVISAAASAGKSVYFPAGKYYLSGAGLTLPSNTTLRGDGDNSVLKRYDSGDRPSLLFTRTESVTTAPTRNITISHLKLTGTGLGEPYIASLILMNFNFTENITIDNVTGDLGLYFLKCDGQTANCTFRITDCVTTENVHMPFFTAHIAGGLIDGCTLGATRSGTAKGGPPHHFYFADYTTNVTVTDCRLTGGQSQSLHVYPGGADNILFDGITMEDIHSCAIVEGNTGPVTMKNLTLTSNTRYRSEFYFLSLAAASNVTLEDFIVHMPENNGDYLVYTSYGSSNNVIRNGTITNSVYTPTGCLALYDGTIPVYDNVTVNGTVVSDL